MRTLLVASMLLSVLLAGCFDGDVGPGPGPDPGNDPPPDDDPPPTPAPGKGIIEGRVIDPDGVVADAYVWIVGTDNSTRSSHDGKFRFLDITPGLYLVKANEDTSARNASASVTVQEGAIATVTLDFNVSALPPDDGPGPSDIGFDCPDGPVIEPTPTFGQDAGFHGMTWGALKTGFRFAVAIPDADGASLEYSVDGGDWQTLDQSTQESPFFVIDDLPEGGFICFRATVGSDTSDVHGAWLANGPTSFDEASQTYTLNIFILAAEGPEREPIEGGMPIYTEGLWDASDGWIRAGVVFIVYGGIDDAVDAVEICATPVVTLGTQFLCENQFDMYFTHQENPLAAGSTPKNGLHDPHDVIRMNQLHEASMLFGDAREVGKVTLHELGHYAMGLDDMYASLAGGPDCFDAGKSISVMGSNRDATEFDDELNQCPNIDAIEADGQTYVPSWTTLQEQYSSIPERTEIDPGPSGDGGSYGAIIIDWA